MWSYIVGGVFLALAMYFIVQGIRCGAAVRESKNRLAAYNAQTAAYVELLDKLGIDKVYLLATSAGGSVAGSPASFRFTKFTPLTTRPLLTSRHGIILFVNISFLRPTAVNQQNSSKF